MESNLTDHELIESIISGSEEATSLLICRYQDFAFNLSLKILGNRQNAEEAVQDSFVKAIKALKAFKGTSTFKTWFYRIVYNTAINRGRKGLFHKNIPIETIEESQLADDENEETNLYDQRFQRLQINAAFDKLKPENRIIVTLYYLENFSLEEIAEVMLLSTNVVKIRLHRSRELLKVHLKKVE